MRICQHDHSPIVHINNRCPLCVLTEHNNIVHDFIESKGRGLIGELVAFQHRKTSGLEVVQNSTSTNTESFQLLCETCRDADNCWVERLHIMKTTDKCPHYVKYSATKNVS